MTNKDLKANIKEENIYMWQVANKLNVHESTFSKWFREELSNERKLQVMSAIEEIRLDRLNEQVGDNNK